MWLPFAATLSFFFQNQRTNVHFSLFLANSCRLCVGFERGRGQGFYVEEVRRGFESPALGPNQKNDPVAGAVSDSMVGDEGFEPPALCV